MDLGSDMTIPAGAVTTADLYRELSMIREVIVRLDERASALPDHEARIRVLERFRYTLLGVSTAVGAAAGVASSVISSHLH